MKLRKTKRTKRSKRSKNRKVKTRRQRGGFESGYDGVVVKQREDLNEVIDGLPVVKSSLERSLSKIDEESS